MQETDYHRLADQTLNRFADALEAADENGELEVELEGVVLTIDLPNGKQYLISKHAPSRQLWVSSPISGGLHFAYDAPGWRLPDGRELAEVVSAELATLASVKVAL